MTAAEHSIAYALQKLLGIAVIPEIHALAYGLSSELPVPCESPPMFMLEVILTNGKSLEMI
ncbi:hypothetical protein N7509_013342 [Penicillium cosmopolitanum]|uniref:Uncharacterized protein n=1 Tax=Penicillium cosmopolitanum TaxID=1131564 RepID=A0A9W9SD45_9EURO|nr:uncharacterized protein N7509_013342 [Penicillium cosmopolitanum]KAJ5376456.1 hypothetical protein N7509_013342 [Penicillium cosmopolitanum]